VFYAIRSRRHTLTRRPTAIAALGPRSRLELSKRKEFYPAPANGLVALNPSLYARCPHELLSFQELFERGLARQNDTTFGRISVDRGAVVD
jgi:hypothetical protein